jgi:hypothetical protein
VEGDADYLLHHARGAVRLSDGRLAILNAGTRELRVYGPTGVHQVSMGREGGGPGELRAPARIRLAPGDTLRILDQTTNLESTFSPAGGFVRAETARASHDPPFAGDTWLHGRNYVTDPAGTAVRQNVEAVLDALPPTGPGTYRYVRADVDGRLWLRIEPADPAAASRWTVHSPPGKVLASAVTPPGFDLLDAGRDYVLGRVLDAVDVEHVVLYEFDPIDDTRIATEPAASGHARTGESGGREVGHAPVARAPIDEAVLKSMQSMLRQGMALQEIFYSLSGTGRYASSASQLDWPEDMEGLTVHVLDGSDRGWTMIVVHEQAGVMCGAAVGAGGPIGWAPGLVVCPTGG